MKREDYVTLVDVDGYDCSWEDKVVVTMGFNRWELSLRGLVQQTYCDRPTFVIGYNIDPELLGLEKPIEMDSSMYPESDRYFRLTNSHAYEILCSWVENRLDEFDPQ